MTSLTDDQLSRWACQVLLPELGPQGQERLLSASVLIAGVGALGCGVAAHLAAAGVGELILADPDTVEIGNIHRQSLYATPDIGRPKVQAAGERLRAIHPDLQLTLLQEALDEARTFALAAQADVVVDGTDTFESRHAINAACVRAGKPLVHGACVGFEGRVMTILPGEGPCFRCVVPEAPPPHQQPRCSQMGIIGPVAGLVSSIETIEVMKLLLGIPDVLVGRMVAIDALTHDYRVLRVARRADCCDCGPAS
jgi:molybdopterin/thiamine biosynthesis adenylyltransferase